MPAAPPFRATQLIDDAATELAGGSGDEEHVFLQNWCDGRTVTQSLRTK
jgi:hypothetical protein